MRKGKIPKKKQIIWGATLKCSLFLAAMFPRRGIIRILDSHSVLHLPCRLCYFLLDSTALRVFIVLIFSITIISTVLRLCYFLLDQKVTKKSRTATGMIDDKL
jgi:hypothetical protein